MKAIAHRNLDTKIRHGSAQFRNSTIILPVHVSKDSMSYPPPRLREGVRGGVVDIKQYQTINYPVFKGTAPIEFLFHREIVDAVPLRFGYFLHGKPSKVDNLRSEGEL